MQNRQDKPFPCSFSRAQTNTLLTPLNSIDYCFQTQYLFFSPKWTPRFFWAIPVIRPTSPFDKHGAGGTNAHDLPGVLRDGSLWYNQGGRCFVSGCLFWFLQNFVGDQPPSLDISGISVWNTKQFGFFTIVSRVLKLEVVETCHDSQGFPKPLEKPGSFQVMLLGGCGVGLGAVPLLWCLWHECVWRLENTWKGKVWFHRFLAYK